VTACTPYNAITLCTNPLWKSFFKSDPGTAAVLVCPEYWRKLCKDFTVIAGGVTAAINGRLRSTAPTG
jgi:hypothetical protein